ncbi:MAG: type II secretion system F family protein [Acidobacteria bacterium]|nr:type II secretion system F family protein [Acidobacteriota bacterium]
MALVLITFAAVFLLVVSGSLLFFYRRALVSRLALVASPQTEGAESFLQRFLHARSHPSIAKVIDPFQRILPRSPEEVSVIQRRLILAGYRKDSHVNIFYGAKVVAPIALAVLATVTQTYVYGPFFVYGLSLGLGFLLPDFWLGNRIKARQLKIRLGLPEALDLMVICIEAGLGVDQAVLRVADELRLSQPVISEEFNLVNLEQRAGRPRAEAWRNLAARTDVDSVRALVNLLIQTEQFGTSISKALRVHSDTLRTKRRQQAEEQAAKTTVKLVFPLVFCIFPSLFVVVLGPSLIAIMEGFRNFLL